MEVTGEASADPERLSGGPNENNGRDGETWLLELLLPSVGPVVIILGCACKCGDAALEDSAVSGREA